MSFRKGMGKRSDHKIGWKGLLSTKELTILLSPLAEQKELLFSFNYQQES